MMIKNRTITATLAVLMMLVTACQSAVVIEPAEVAGDDNESQTTVTEKDSLIIATASTGGTFYPVGLALSTLTNVKLEDSGIQMTTISSAGSAENVQLLKDKKADLAILQGLFGAMAWQGRGLYAEGAEQEMRSITMLWENVEHIVVDADYATTGNISDLDTMNGEAFSIGKRGSGTETSGTVILNALGYDVTTTSLQSVWGTQNHRPRFKMVVLLG